jgi:hypothetical protein
MALRSWLADCERTKGLTVPCNCEHSPTKRSNNSTACRDADCMPRCTPVVRSGSRAAKQKIGRPSPQRQIARRPAGCGLASPRVLDCTEYAANESSFVMADKILHSLARDISRRQWCISRIRQSLRFVVGAERDGECLGVAMSPKGA